MLKSFINKVTGEKVFLGVNEVLNYEDLKISIGGNIPFENVLDSKEDKKNVMHTMPKESRREEETSRDVE